ncbi:MAG: aminotransferase class I/II-fold pyridoxal phosphate-dependent enzyme [bacterium]
MTHQKNSTPLFDALESYIKSNKVSFHTPGHKHGKSILPKFKKLVNDYFCKMDLSSSCQIEIDTLYYPCGPIKHAQSLASKAYGADISFFLINGTTVGNQTMILSTVISDEEIIIPRNAHKSVISGIILSGAIPHYIIPEINKETGLIYNIIPSSVEKALLLHPKAKAVLVTSPSYYGITTNLKKIASIVHKQKKLLLVDEAHGPHLKFSSLLPLSALESGADICVQSIHKIISGLSQGSILHIKGKRVNVEKVENFLQMMQTTSPSYIILASLDLARYQMAKEGEKKIKKVIELSSKLKESIKKLDYFYVLEKSDLEKDFDLDLMKVMIFIKDNLFSGYFLEDILRKEYNIQVELSTYNSILLFITIGNDEKDIKKIIAALKDISRKKKFPENKLLKKKINFNLFPSLKMIMSPREAVFKHSKLVPLKKSKGNICAEIICFYPPGIPILIPGEQITDEIIDYLEYFRSFNNNNNSNFIKVVVE